LLGLACAGCGHAAADPPQRPWAVLAAARASGGISRLTARLFCPARVFSRMTQAQRVGQLFLVAILGDPGYVVAPAVSTYHFGSLLMATASTAGVAEIRQVTRAAQALATARTTAGVRFFLAANQEGGEVLGLQGPGFSVIPSALAQGQLSASALRRQAEAWARQLRSAGINLDLAPVMDVVPPGTASQNQPIGMLQREFGFTPATVAAHGVAFIRGLRQEGVAATAKHFPGLGRVLGNTDVDAEVVDTQTLPYGPDLASYQAAIDAGVPFVMVSLAIYTRIDPRHLAVFSSRVMRGILRQQMRYDGVIMSDDLSVATAVASIPAATRAIDFLAAGGDMITSESLTTAIAMEDAILRRVAVDPAFRSEVDSAVMRVLDAKQAFGLLPC
jgi:beta-N-acetylhexosaminidase